MSKLKRIKARKFNEALSKQKAEMYSLWCTELYKLSIANEVALTVKACNEEALKSILRVPPFKAMLFCNFTYYRQKILLVNVELPFHN